MSQACPKGYQPLLQPPGLLHTAVAQGLHPIHRTHAEPFFPTQPCAAWPQ